MGRRAGCPPDSQQMKDLLTALSNSDAVEIFGFYSRMSRFSLLSLPIPCWASSEFMLSKRPIRHIWERTDRQISDNPTLPNPSIKPLNSITLRSNASMQLRNMLNQWGSHLPLAPGTSGYWALELLRLLMLLLRSKMDRWILKVYLNCKSSQV